MKRVFSLVIIGALTAPALPVAAQETVVRSVGPIRSAPANEAGGPLAGLQADWPTRNEDSSVLEWPRVRKLKPGSEIRFMAPDAMPVTRYFVAADERTLTVLNLDQSRLSRTAGRALLKLVSRDPAILLRTDRDELVLSHEQIRVAPEGLFVGLRKVADRDEFVQTMSRADIQRFMAIGQAGHQGLSGSAKLAIGVAVTIGSLMILTRMMMPTG